MSQASSRQTKPDVLDFYLAKAVMLEKVPVQSLIQRVLATFKLPPGRLMPVLGMPGAPLVMVADPERVREMLLKVIANAYLLGQSNADVNICVMSQDCGISIRVNVMVMGVSTEKTVNNLLDVAQDMTRTHGELKVVHELDRSVSVTLCFPESGQAPAC
jgi:hypothetical protein